VASRAADAGTGQVVDPPDPLVVHPLQSGRAEVGGGAAVLDQAVRGGEVVVAVEDHSPQAPARLARAASILAGAGTKPVPLPEG